MLQEEKQLAGFKKGDELTEQGDNVADDGNFDLEKFQHGVHFGDPADYVDHPEDVDQFLFDEKEFFNMNEGGLNSDLNNPANNPSSEFEKSDNQLMEIIRNKKKPTPRITVDRTIKTQKNHGNPIDDIAQLGNKIPELVAEEIGVKRFKKLGAKERGVPDLSTTDFNTNTNKGANKGNAGGNRGIEGADPNVIDRKVGSRSKPDEKVGTDNGSNKKGNGLGQLNTIANQTGKRHAGPLDDLEEVNSMDEADIREKEAYLKKVVKLNDKDSADESSNNLTKEKHFKRKPRKSGINKEEDGSLGGSVDSQENLILGKELPTKYKQNNNDTVKKAVGG